MNKRIRELAERAELAELYDRYVEYCMKNADDDIMDYDTIVKKFAELIVQECMACSTWVGRMNKTAIEPVHTAYTINQRIKQHFGVEE